MDEGRNQMSNALYYRAPDRTILVVFAHDGAPRIRNNGTCSALMPRSKYGDGGYCWFDPSYLNTCTPISRATALRHGGEAVRRMESV
jgi:hypothetical protein